MKKNILASIFAVVLIGVVLYPTITNAQDEIKGYPYQWFDRNNLTCDQISQELGVKVLEITRGEITEGKIGTQITFERQPTTEQLNKLDMMLPELKRDGGISISDELTQLKQQVTSLQTHVDSLSTGVTPK